jgi:hypothetical protein
MEKKILVSLDKWNKDKKAARDIANEMYPLFNGLSCPVCEKELQDTDDIVPCTNPAQQHIKCSSCDFSGNRFR